MPTTSKLPADAANGKKSLTIELTEDICKKLTEVAAMCRITSGEYIEDSIGSTLNDVYESGPTFVLSCFTWDRAEVKTICRNVRRFMRRHLPDKATNPEERFRSVPLEDEPDRWGIERIPVQEPVTLPEKASAPENQAWLSCSKDELIELFLGEREVSRSEHNTIMELSRIIIDLRRNSPENLKRLLIRSLEEQMGKAKASSEMLNKDIAACERYDANRASDLRFQNTLLHVEMEVLERQVAIISASASSSATAKPE